MEAILMNAGIITAIILCVIGIIKLPFDSFKEKHPKGYKATFTIVSLVLTFGACLINQAFILSQPLFNTNFISTLLSTYAGVFVSYHSYEGLGLKELLKRLLNAIKNLRNSAPQSKLSKYIDKVGIDVALNIINAKQSEVTKVEVENATVENAVVEKQVINATVVEVNNAEVHNATVNTQN